MARNASYMMRHISQASSEGADIVHFPECALPGYARVDFPSFKDIDWDSLARFEKEIAYLAGELCLSVVFGSYRRVNGGVKVRNCLRVVSNEGEVVATYDKINLHGKGETQHCEPGESIRYFTLNGMRCGLLICFDMCFPHLFDRYRDEDVKLLFLSCHNARNPGAKQALDELMTATLRTRAADNGMWISAANSCARHSRLAACIAMPDGSLLSLRRHRPGVLYHEFPDTNLGWTYNNRIGYRCDTELRDPVSG